MASLSPLAISVIREMPVNKSPIEKAAGKLVSSIQKEWGKDLGDSTARISEDVMGKGHVLLQASKNNEVFSVLDGLSVTQYLGASWVHRHPSVKEHIAAFEKELTASENV